MIVATLYGGIGNQMFIYAAARSISLSLNSQLILDIKSGFKRDKEYNRIFCIDNFDIKYQTNKFLTYDFPLGRYIQKLSELVGFHILYPKYRYISENEIENQILKGNKNMILKGSWVKEKYFKNNTSIIRNDFIFKRNFSSEVFNLAAQIKTTGRNAVGVGIRIYQEIKNESVRQNGTWFYTNKDFYEKAFEFCCKKNQDSVFFIFTQAQEWVKENIDLQKYNCVIMPNRQGDENAIDDMYLMTLCEHYIISNSTFYWWSAWLNSSENKQIVVPEQWTNSTLGNWIKL